MKIAVLGWYGKMNLGDEYIQNAITRLFKDSAITFWGHFPGTSVLNQFDHLIIGGGSIWPNPFFANYTKIRKRLLTPFSILGVSAREVLDQAVTKQIIGDAFQVIVRDNASKRLMYENTKIKVGNDLTWLNPIEISKSSSTNKINGINLRKWTEVDWNPCEIVKKVNNFSDDVVALPFYYGSELRGQNELADEEVMGHCGLSTAHGVTNTRDYQALRIVVGMRYHSLVLAAQAGLPFISFNYHPKVVAFAEEMGLSDFCIPLNQPELVLEKLIIIENEYDSYRVKAITKRNEQIEISRKTYQEARQAIEYHFLNERKSLRNRVRKVKNKIIDWI